MTHNNRTMKKPLVIIASILLLSMPIRSQVFMTHQDLEKDRSQKWEDAGLVVPIHERDFADEEEDYDYAPLGSGIALLAALGGAYLLGKKHREEA